MGGTSHFMGRVHICKGSPSRSEPASRWLPGPKADGREAGVYALSPGHFAPHQHGALPANSWGGLPGRRPLQPLYVSVSLPKACHLTIFL